MVADDLGISNKRKMFGNNRPPRQDLRLLLIPPPFLNV